MYSLQEIINKRDSFWRQKGPRNDIVMSSRIRLGRNAKSVPFPESLDDSGNDMLRDIIDAFIGFPENQGKTICIDINDLDLHHKRLLHEKNIITNEMENSEKSMVLVNDEKDYTILINDTDHFRIQVIRPGFQLYDTYTIADALDDNLNRFVHYAFSDEWGYLTPNPANLGTGLKVSAIVHLPVLTVQKRIGESVPFVRERGFQISGTLGNSGRVIGGLYLLSNRRYIGLTEIDLLDAADDILNRIIKMEDDARDDYFANSKHELEDMVWRSLGIMMYARRINYVEAIEHLSRLRLGAVMSVVKDYNLMVINDLMVRIQWSHLQEYFGIRFKSIVDSDDYRAVFLRNELRNGGGNSV